MSLKAIVDVKCRWILNVSWISGAIVAGDTGEVYRLGDSEQKRTLARERDPGEGLLSGKNK
jgi:dihydrodipicolinate synthase/N-acetylneuraminate lyase